MKLSKQQLRLLVESEAKKIDEGIMDTIIDTGENLAVTALGHAIVGDAAALFKAATLDLGRVISDVAELNTALKPYGIDMSQFVMAKDARMDPAIAQLAMADQGTRDQIAEMIENLVSDNIKLLVSVISAFPDVAVSGTISAGLTALNVLPLESILPKIAEYTNDFLNMVESIPGGEAATKVMEIVSRMLSGPVGWLFGDPVNAYRNIGKLVAATDGVVPEGAEVVTAELVAESRWMKMAGIIK